MCRHDLIKTRRYKKKTGPKREISNSPQGTLTYFVSCFAETVAMAIMAGLIAYTPSLVVSFLGFFFKMLCVQKFYLKEGGKANYLGERLSFLRMLR